MRLEANGILFRCSTPCRRGCAPAGRRWHPHSTGSEEHRYHRPRRSWEDHPGGCHACPVQHLQSQPGRPGEDHGLQRSGEGAWNHYPVKEHSRHLQGETLIPTAELMGGGIPLIIACHPSPPAMKPGEIDTQNGKLSVGNRGGCSD